MLCPVSHGAVQYGLHPCVISKMNIAAFIVLCPSSQLLLPEAVITALDDVSVSQRPSVQLLSGEMRCLWGPDWPAAKKMWSSLHFSTLLVESDASALSQVCYSSVPSWVEIVTSLTVPCGPERKI